MSVLVIPRILMAFEDAVNIEPVGEFALKVSGGPWRPTMCWEVRPRRRRHESRRYVAESLQSRHVERDGECAHQDQAESPSGIEIQPAPR